MQVVARRLIQLVVVLLVVTFFTSILTALLPGDPVTTIAPFSSAQDRATLRQQLHLNENVVERYGQWLANFSTGNMGREYAGNGIRGTDIWGRIKDTLPRSLTLMLYVQILTLLIAVPLGVYTAYRAGSRVDDVANGIAFFLLSIPIYVAATLMLLFLSVQHHLLPSEGWVSITTNPVEHFKHLVMPVLAITLGQIAVYARLLRTDMVATLQEDFILMAKSKGISERRVLWRHALRPSSLTLLTVAGLNVGTLIGGALIVEVIFHLNGLGFAIYDAISRRQYIALQDYIAVIAIVYVLVNFAVDALYHVLDPRIRGARIG
ncbi:MAG TPA: ABC transporter permease [Acidimicrobiia bacterium]|nr:ABC transporter permease [Acidimicrobiia bacterium]